MFHLPLLNLNFFKGDKKPVSNFSCSCSFSKPCLPQTHCPNLSTGPTLMPVLWLKEQNPVCFNLKTHRNPRIQNSYMTLGQDNCHGPHHHSVHSCSKLLLRLIFKFLTMASCNLLSKLCYVCDGLQDIMNRKTRR